MTLAFAIRVLTVIPRGLLVLFVGSYFALLDPSPQYVEPTKGNYLLRNMRFRVVGENARDFFRPIVTIDMEMREKFWCDLTEKGRRWAGESGSNR